MQIKDSTFLITGGSSGIGKAAAKLLIEKGGKVAITASGKDRLEKTAKEIRCFSDSCGCAKQEDIEKTYASFSERVRKT